MSEPLGMSRSKPANRRRRSTVQRPISQQGAVLRPGTSVLWRDLGSVQLELGAKRIVLDGVTGEELAAILARPTPEPIDGNPASAPTGTTRGAGAAAGTGAGTRPGSGTGTGPGRGPSAGATASAAPLTAAGTRLAQRLSDHGFLAYPDDGVGASPDVPAQLLAELTALAGRCADPTPVLAARRSARVSIHGNAQISASLATVLAAAGIGRLGIHDRGQADARHASPSGVPPAAEGTRYFAAVTDAVRRAAPHAQVGPIPVSGEDLAVLTDPGPIDEVIRSDLHRRGTAHLVVSVQGSDGVVGPLVVPGLTSCLRCADLYRTDRDPCWPLLAVQLAQRPRYRAASENALLVATAGLAAGQILAHLDGGQQPDSELPAAMGASLEWSAATWRLRRRRWPIHPDCDCGAAG